MKTYYVYKHDHRSNQSVNLLPGFHVTCHDQGFRDVPITSLEWSEVVVANSKYQAIGKARTQHNLKRQTI